MGIDNTEQMQEALLEASDGTVTLDGMLAALAPYQTTMNVMNEMFRTIPSGAVSLMLAIFTGTIAFDDELRVPEIPVEHRMTLHTLHALVAYRHLRDKTETDPAMAEYAISRQSRTRPPPLPDPHQQLRSTFSLLLGFKVDE